jgi:hypothetical protein
LNDEPDATVIVAFLQQFAVRRVLRMLVPIQPVERTCGLAGMAIIEGV